MRMFLQPLSTVLRKPVILFKQSALAGHQKSAQSHRSRVEVAAMEQAGLDSWQMRLRGSNVQTPRTHIRRSGVQMSKFELYRYPVYSVRDITNKREGSLKGWLNIIMALAKNPLGTNRECAIRMCMRL